MGGNCYLKYQIANITTNDDRFSSGYYVDYTLPKSAVISQGSSSLSLNSRATSSTHSATSKDHAAVGIGVGIGVPVGLGILAGCFYFVRRQAKTQPEELLKMHAVANDKNDNGLREPQAERRFDELPAENTSAELFVPPAEL